MHNLFAAKLTVIHRHFGPALTDKVTRFLKLFDIPNLDKDLRLKLICQDRLIPGKEKNYQLDLATNSVSLIVRGEKCSPAGYLGLIDFSRYI